jgi:hypothetical protein
MIAGQTSKRPDYRSGSRQMFNFEEFSLTITAENLSRLRAKLPPKTKSLFSSIPAYVAIERAIVLGSERIFDGSVFLLEPDGRLMPVDGGHLAALHRDFPNFVRNWKLPAAGW